jgi:hypothetical protein
MVSILRRKKYIIMLAPLQYSPLRVQINEVSPYHLIPFMSLLLISHPPFYYQREQIYSIENYPRILTITKV